MHRTVVLNVVGLTPRLLGPYTPNLRRFAEGGGLARIRPVTPAVTCAAQATYLTGVWPDRHGIVGNGWYFRDECEVRFWRQSNRLVSAPKVWELARAIDPDFTCANLFWWYNMYSSVDFSITPRPMYPADGRKIPDIYTAPGSLKDALVRDLGPFPFFDFWGPKTSIRSSRWIADAALWIDRHHRPSLNLVYLPHLDYDLQKYGPDDPRIPVALREIDAVCGDLFRHFEAEGARIVVLSEYGISGVSRPVHINRVLREHGLVAVREELGLEMLDAGASAAFAVADHQVAHVYINDVEKAGRVRELLERTPGVEQVLDAAGKRAHHLDHPRAGDLVVIAAQDAWFTYYYWLDDRRAPDFARTVDIHRKPGYDPVEMFIDPSIRVPALKVGWYLLKKKLGFRALMDVIPLEASLIRGSHGRPPASLEDGALCMTRDAGLLEAEELEPTEVCALILRHLGLAREAERRYA